MPTSEFDDLERVRGIIEDRFGCANVLVVGDLMLDQHVWGAVTRISPEAPVPVVRRTRQAFVAGGAGNVAMNLVGFGLRPRLVALVGHDDAAAQVRGELERSGVDVSGVLEDTGRPTTTKIRVIGGHQQMLRLDHESTEPPSSLMFESLMAVIEDSMDGCSAVVLSDYAKGVLTSDLCRRTIQAAHSRGIPVLVDPKGSDWEKYRGASRVTPNRSELAVASGQVLPDRESLTRAAEEIRRELDLEALVVTLSEEGIVQFSEGRSIWTPALAKEVFDVSGAGDTAIAALTAAVAVGLADRDALLLANLAAGIVVGKVGTVPLLPGELLASIDSFDHLPLHSKIHDLEAAKSLVETWQSEEGKRVVFTNGCFDLLHAGHVTYLSAARRLGDKLVLGLNSDSSVRRLKGPSRPINEADQRALVLAGLESVDAIVVFDEDTPLSLIQALRPDVLAKGADYQENEIVGAGEVRNWGGTVQRVALVEGISTTRIAERINRS